MPVTSERAPRPGPPAWTPWRYRDTGAMLALYRRAFQVVDGGGTIQMHWNTAPLDANAFRREFRSALHRRINDKAAPPPRGRKHADLYQVELLRDRDRVVDIVRRRIRHYQFATPEVHARFAHLLSSRDDF